MEDNLSNIRLKFKCTADYSAMPNVEGGRFCSQCQKTVHDFTNTKADVFRQILAENNYNVCGRFAPQQMMTTEPAVKPMWKRWISAAMILIGFNMVQQKAFAQGGVRADTPKAKTDSAFKVDTSAYFWCVDERQPEYPGGMTALYKLFTDNLRSIPGAKGKRVFITFVVETDGTLSGVKVMRGINAEADEEALRVIRLTPKWHPAVQNGKPVRVQYNVPIAF